MRKNKLLILLPVFILSLFTMLYKLDSAYFFTDEILYVDAGQEYKRSDYTLNLQHPLLGKYISSITSGTDQRNVPILRLPFALLGVFSSLLVFAIIRKELDFWWGILGSTIYITMPFIFSTSRAVLLESPMHFFWLLFSFFVLRYFKHGKNISIYLAGVFLGLSMAVKFTSIILIPAFVFTCIFLHYILKSPVHLKIRDISVAIFISIAVFLAHYSHLVLVTGFKGLLDVSRAFKDVILSRNSEGKTHVVGDSIYDRSPWWFYTYYIKESYGVIKAGVIGVFAVLGFQQITVFSFYWLTLFVTGAVYLQSLTLKNSRYIASLEVPLVFVVVLGLNWVYKKAGRVSVGVVVIIILGFQIIKVSNIKPDSYNAAYLKVSTATSNFTNGERTLIFGSVRTSKWYFKGPEDYIVIRKDLDPLKGEFGNFKYILVDSWERLKYPGSVLFKYLLDNQEKYYLYKFDNVVLYVLKDTK